ncbi:MAG: flagellar motor switch protein FliN [Planctomycetaceae bacterium]|nr:flagellar motor switch protein FliN [Planctomycetaceae bacterium]
MTDSEPSSVPQNQNPTPSVAPDGTSKGDSSSPNSDPTTDAIRDATVQVDRLAGEAEAVAEARAVELPDFGSSAGPGDPTGIGMLGDVDLDVRIELGRTRMLVDDVLRLSPESVVELDKAAGDPVDIYVNGRHVARGEVLVLNENFCVRVSEIVGRLPEAGTG